MSLLTGRNDCYPLSDDSIQTEVISIRYVTAGRIILAETFLGALGNLPLLCHYLLNCTEVQVRPIDLIFMHLTLSNSLVIVSKGIPQTMAAFGLKHVFSDLGCHFILYLQSLGRGVSIGTTCLLFVFQAITISPIDSCCRVLKVKAPHYVNISISLYWIFYMVIYLFFSLHILYMSTKWSMEKITYKIESRNCYMDYNENIFVPVCTALIAFPSSVLIVWASGSMILFLHRHKQSVQHIHSNHVSSRSSAETRVTQRILVLVSAFVCFYTPSSLLSMCLALSKNQNQVLCNIADFISLCFPTVSPFLIIRPDRTVSKLSLL
ncbi:vomeronasal type-1 receptor 4-like [Suncus etruscus]|uniref:vomeronasal type-1 receptor 4-like n=1 Tax=Suncus etruscus TaxID=109475 RepID=UPI00210F3DCA|nr:vomeronasal type-1 receptor 4-like [Suncus etruscus]